MTAHPRPFAGSYALLRSHGADQQRLRALIDGEDDGMDDEPRCACCGCWVGFGENPGLCDWCRYDENDRV